MERFSDLLSEAIRRIQLHEGNKPVAVIHDELGYALGRDGGSAIAYWRKGHIPKVADIEKLARELIRRSELEAGWLRRFLTAAEYPYPAALVEELFPQTPVTPKVVTPLPSGVATVNALPVKKSYSELIGREAVINDLLDKLSDPVASPLVGVDGAGGIGKTALLYEVVQRARKRRLFEAMIWVNAVGTEDETALQVFMHLLRLIGQQFVVADMAERTDQELLAHLQHLLGSRSVLLVLDNLEVTGQLQAELIQHLLPLLGSSRALLASRRRFVGDLYTVHLPGLNLDDVAAFLRQEAHARGLPLGKMLPEHELQAIIRATNGSPLALKLVVGQLTFLPLALILDRLRGGALQHHDASDPYQSIYTDIFMPTWGLLSEVGQRLLLAMSLFVPGLGVTIEAVGAVSGLLNGALFQAINELWQLSLLEVSLGQDSDLSDKRYYLHALTQNFVNTVILAQSSSANP